MLREFAAHSLDVLYFADLPCVVIIVKRAQF